MQELETTVTHGVQDLCDRGLYIQAFEASKKLGPLKRWTGPAARTLAGRLAAQVGAVQLSYCSHFLAWREAPDEPETRFFWARTRLNRRGPYFAWKTLSRYGDLPDGPPEIRADWCALRGFVAANFRDFDSAEKWHRQAEEFASERPWIWRERSAALAIEDRYQESLETAQHALELKPFFPPTVLATAEALILLGRDEEALALLNEANQHVESGYIQLKLADLHSDLGHAREAYEAYENAARLFPLMERGLAHWLAGRRSDMAYRCGDVARATELAWLASNPYHQRIAKSLSESIDDGEHVLLPVEFVRQHHMTCAPATVAAISRYWSRPVEHLSLAEEICYDGTSAHSQRKWAEENGWHVREFTVEWPSAKALLDEGIPFCLSTVEPTSAHMQAVIGYDTRRNVLLVRDPYQRAMSELLIREMLSRYRFCGPRGLAFVPPEKADVLKSLELADAPLYDQMYQLQTALLENERDQAQEILDAMRQTDPDHRLTWEARLSISSFDSDLPSTLDGIEKLLGMYPRTPLLELRKLSCLHALGRESDELRLLDEICSRPQCHPVFWQHHATALAQDAREHDRAFHWLRRTLRYYSNAPHLFHAAARILWQRREFHEAIHINRIAACLNDKNEEYARDYFIAARQLKQTDEVVQFLENRALRLAGKSSEPIGTLFWALEQLDQTPRAFAVLEEALQRRQDDAELQLLTAEAYGRHGRFADAERLLAAAEPRSRSNYWLRKAAEISMYRGDRPAALEYWKKVLAKEPQAADAHQAVSQLLAEVEGHSAALEHLSEAAAAHETNFHIQSLYIHWLKGMDPFAAERITQQFVERCPNNAWAWRELAVLHARLGRIDEALSEAETARNLEPGNPDVFNTIGFVHAAAGNREAAQEAYRQAIRISVDSHYAITQLMGLCDSLEVCQQELGFLQEQLSRQVIFGDGLLLFRDHARTLLHPDQLLQTLREGNEARPDLWQTWSALTWQLLDMNYLTEAHDIATQAVQRFPLVAPLWFDRAHVCRAQQDAEGQVKSLHRVLEISPNFFDASEELVRLYMEQNDYDSAQHVLERAIASDPLQVEAHKWLAMVLERKGDLQAAVTRLEQAIRINPTDEWCWEALSHYAAALGDHELSTRVARELTTRRPGNATCWYVLARTLREPEQQNERLQALETAIRLEPRMLAAHDELATLFAERGELDKALKACEPNAFPEGQPVSLMARAAEIKARQGDFDTAIREMTEIIERDPRITAAWEQLLAWHQRLNPSAYLETARRYASMFPTSSVALHYLAHAKEITGDLTGARQDLRTAVDLDPYNHYVAMALFTLCVTQGELDAAEQLLPTLRGHGDSDELLEGETLFAAAKGDCDAAVACLRRLCVARATQPGTIHAVIDAFKSAGWLEIAGQILRESLEREDVHPDIAFGWTRYCHGEDWDRCQATLDGLRERPDLWRYASAGYVGALAEHREGIRFKNYLAGHREVFREDSLLWHSIASALVQFGKEAEAVDSYFDRPEHIAAEPKLLLDLAVAAYKLGKKVESWEMHESAIRLPADESTSAHLLWLASRDIFQRGYAQAEGRLRVVDPQLLPEYYQALCALVTSMAEIHARRKQAGTLSFRRAQQMLRTAANPHLPTIRSDARLNHYYKRCLRRIAKDHGGVFANAWTRLRTSLS